MSAPDHPEWRRGREHHELRNEYRAACPPVDLWTYAPRGVVNMTMYERGWNSVQDCPLHSCRTCREGGVRP